MGRPPTVALQSAWAAASPPSHGRSYVCVAGMSSSVWPTNLHARHNGLHVYAYLNCVIKFLLQHADAFNDTVAYIFNLRYFCSFPVTTLQWIIVSSEVSHLASIYVGCVSG